MLGMLYLGSNAETTVTKKVLTAGKVIQITLKLAKPLKIVPRRDAARTHPEMPSTQANTATRLEKIL